MSTMVPHITLEQIFACKHFLCGDQTAHLACQPDTVTGHRGHRLNFPTNCTKIASNSTIFRPHKTHLNVLLPRFANAWYKHNKKCTRRYVDPVCHIRPWESESLRLIELILRCSEIPYFLK